MSIIGVKCLSLCLEPSDSLNRFQCVENFSTSPINFVPVVSQVRHYNVSKFSSETEKKVDEEQKEEDGKEKKKLN